MPFHTILSNPDELHKVLTENSSWVVLKFSALWCGPCKKIEPFVGPWLHRVSEHNVQVYLLDIDENFEMYGYFKNKKRISGIPAIMAFKRGNVSYIPDLFVSGINPADYETFFKTISTS